MLTGTRVNNLLGVLLDAFGSSIILLFLFTVHAMFGEAFHSEHKKEICLRPVEFKIKYTVYKLYSNIIPI